MYRRWRLNNASSACSWLACTVQYCTVLYCAVLCCAVLYCAVLCCAVLYCTVLYCTVLLPPGENPTSDNKYIYLYNFGSPRRIETPGHTCSVSLLLPAGIHSTERAVPVAASHRQQVCFISQMFSRFWGPHRPIFKERRG